MESMPARIARFAPSAPCACAAVFSFNACASSTSASSSACVSCGVSTESAIDKTPPVAQVLIMVAPYLCASRTAERALVDGVAQPDVQIILRADVADGSESGHQGDACIYGGVDSHFRDGLLQIVKQRFAVVLAVLHGEVGVGVDEAGEKRGVAEVDDFGAGGNGGALADADDLAVADDYNAGLGDGVAFAVKHARGFEDVSLAAGLLRVDGGGNQPGDDGKS